jgi:hypothetical protein
MGYNAQDKIKCIEGTCKGEIGYVVGYHPKNDAILLIKFWGISVWKEINTIQRA